MTLPRLALLVLLAGPPLAAAAQEAGSPDFGAALEAADSGEWARAAALAESVGPVAGALIEWERLRDDEGNATWDEVEAFLAAHPDWPDLDAVRETGERAIPAGADPARVIAFFADTAPTTAEGVLALARALEAEGRAEEAEAAVVEAWLTLGLDAEAQADILAAHGTMLGPHHAARADAMLWRWRTSDAERLLDFLDPDQRLLAEARIALIRDTGDAAERLAAVPAALQGDPGLANARFNRFASRGDYDSATGILLDQTGSAEALGQPFRWASWRATLARWHMREGRTELAYRLAAQHFLTEGDYYADLEWLAGYIALTYEAGPEAALFHFDRLLASVEGPISVSRGEYWTGRALRAAGREEEARAAFARGAVHQTAYYGLLSLDEIGGALDDSVAGAAPLTPWEGSDWAAGELWQAMELTLAAGERGTAWRFVTQMARTFPQEGLEALGGWLTAREETWLTVLVGKSAAARGIIIPQLYFPLHEMAERDWPVETALALSIARRESEFNIGVGSPVGALGLMQLMPGTAQEVAGDLGLPYARDRLTSDWEYNARLGTRYLEMLNVRFGDSPVIMAIGYNAGPGRAQGWVRDYGDPRESTIDVVNWIEEIPFTETRNYVMRVTESIPVYRARLAGQGGQAGFLSLLRGELPPVAAPDSAVRPAIRPGTPAPSAPAPAEAAATDLAATPPEPVGTGWLRPIARPES
ncbi:lytic transglycosylase domain-containing protein [Wenxinia saemankumensis]|uniref:Soluble lytic murein transglycosylase n=1 Tax=Wenxinia saemankumensis TaxID=1447782 RepID=A0A1M6EQP2_9RHOB|nr:lytic transglycosylase domain-containing protein [Wenxinia saemankumensis]SHI87590.1 soluble lytic murein transglycosylase [Wenxinia saemankumensis]